MAMLPVLSSEVKGIQFPAFTCSAVPASKVSANISVPKDDATGKYADFVIFGKPVSANFYVSAFSLADSVTRVTNGSFSSDTGWTKGLGWSIAGGVASASASSASLSQNAASSIPLIPGQSYLVTATVVVSSGTISISLGGGTASDAISTSGSISKVVVAGSSQSISVNASSFTGTITNISVVACANTPTSTDSSGLSSELNPDGMLINGMAVISVASDSSTIVTASFYKV